MPKTAATSRNDIVSIQMLRAIAALMVVLVHLDVQLPRIGHAALGNGWGATGVDIFFVISGFIMWVSVERRPAMTAREFMMKRIIRIVPLYWLVTAFMLALLLAAPDLFHSAQFDPWHVLASFLFIPARHPQSGEFWPLLVPGWTLNFEMLFYALFAVAILMAKGRALRRLVAIACLITGFAILALLLGKEVDPLSFYAQPRLFEFLEGVLLGVVFRGRRVPTSAWWWLLTLLGFAGFVTGRIPDLVAAPMVVSGALFGPLVEIRWLKSLGDASYSLYLTHVVVLSGFTMVWIRLGLAALPTAIYCVLAVVASAISAELVYRLIELPMTNYLRRGMRSRSAAPAAT